MSFVSILNDVLGPVMHGPSSSHTAGSYHIGRVLRSLLGSEPARARFVFDPGGSYAQTFRQQGVDLALATGLLGWPITDDRFRGALEFAAAAGLDIAFAVEPLPRADHPNTVDAALVSRSGGTLRATAQSTGGGGFRIVEVDGWETEIDGKSPLLLIECADGAAAEAAAARLRDGAAAGIGRLESGGRVLLTVLAQDAAAGALADELRHRPGVAAVRRAEPVFYVRRGEPLFASAAEMLRLAEERGESLGRIALTYEAVLLGLSEAEVAAEVQRRFGFMRASVEQGFRGEGLRMQLLRPTARKVLDAEASGRMAIGGLHARAAARALAVMHVSNSMGVVVAAPTGGAAGTLPAVVVTLAEEKGLAGDALARALLAASAIGLILAVRGTFAAEVAGCQVEIGAAAAMGAAAVVEAAGGTARQACDAAAISFQNTMGSVCDLVQGFCEIPCHTRNAVFASGAFVCADLILGGYENPIPLDETIDAVMASGRMLPAELRVTSRGGIALAPSALTLPRLR